MLGRESGWIGLVKLLIWRKAWMDTERKMCKRSNVGLDENDLRPR